MSGYVRVPRPGDVVLLGAAASVQFAADRAIVLRVTRVDFEKTYDGWTWLVGYVLNQRGRAVERREVFVQLAGIRTPRPAGRRNGRSGRPPDAPGRRQRGSGA
jgi:hypothetical protein